jgi:outer membrane protein
MMKNRSLSLICLPIALLHVSTARAQATPPTPGHPPTAVPVAPAPRPNPPPVAPAVPAAPGRAAPAGAQPAMPTTPDTAGRGLGDMVHTPMERAVPERPVPTLQDLEPQPGGLTSKEVARRALAVSPSVRQKVEQVVVANEKITQVIAAFLPRLNLIASYTRTSKVNAVLGDGTNFSVSTQQKPGEAITNLNQLNPAPPIAFPFPSDNYLLSARLSIPLSDYVLRVSDAAGATKASKQSAKLQVAAERLKVMNDAKALYYNWLRAWAQVSITKNTVESTKARLTDAQATFAVGSSSKADMLRIEALVANAQLAQDAAETALNLTTGQLAIVMEDWHPNYRIGESIPDPTKIADADAPVDKLVAEAHSRRLELRAIDENIRAAGYGASTVRKSAIPKIDAVGDVTYANPNQRYFPPGPAWHATWSVGAQATWTFSDAISDLSQAREYESNAREAVAQRRLLRAGIANEVLASYLDLSRARTALGQRRIALTAAEEAYRVTTDLFRAGRATGTDLIDSERELLTAKVGEVNARIDLAIAAITLRHATGRDVGDAGPIASND